MHPEAARATLSRPARRFNDGASERSRPHWQGMNAALTVLGGKHAREMEMEFYVNTDMHVYVYVCVRDDSRDLEAGRVFD